MDINFLLKQLAILGRLCHYVQLVVVVFLQLTLT